MVNNEAKTTLRVSDLFSMVPALTGKLELVYEGEQEGAVNVAKHLIGLAIKKTFSEHFPDSRSRVREAKKDVYETVLKWFRSEEHTSELQSRGHLVCRLLLEKKNKR